MAEMEVCDVCRNARRRVTEYRVGTPRKLYRVVLCSEHGAGVVDLIERGSPVASVMSTGVRIWTMEEIEQKKKSSEKLGKAPRRAR